MLNWAGARPGVVSEKAGISPAFSILARSTRCRPAGVPSRSSVYRVFHFSFILSRPCNRSDCSEPFHSGSMYPVLDRGCGRGLGFAARSMRPFKASRFTKDRPPN